MPRRLLLIIVALLWPAAAQAALIVALPEPDLVAKSDTIVFGTVLKTRAVQYPNGWVSTQAEVEVYRGLRGAKPGEIITVEVPGGRLPNGTVVVASGAPQLVPGQLIFGFMETRQGSRRPLGMSFGLLSVRSVGPELRVFRDLDGLQLLTPTGEDAHAEKFLLDGVPLKDFISRIEQHVQKLGDSGSVAPNGQEVTP